MNVTRGNIEGGMRNAECRVRQELLAQPQFKLLPDTAHTKIPRSACRVPRSTGSYFVRDLSAILALEAFDTTGGVHEFLFARKERMAA
jgi:hypothetical protein